MPASRASAHRRRQIGTVADEQQPRRHAAPDAIEDRHHRVDALHRTEVRDVRDDADVGIAVGEAVAQPRHIAAAVQAQSRKFGITSISRVTPSSAYVDARRLLDTAVT